jgi:fatty acid desaturase
MLNDDLIFPTIIGLLGVSVLLRLTLRLYYSDGERLLPLLKLAPPGLEQVRYYKRFDTLLAPAPFVYCWLEIFATLLFFRYTDYHPLAALLLVCVSSGRMRALQETGHNALHSALCPSRKFQWFLSNVFFQFPAIKRDMESRFVTHVKEHHPNADIPGKDPNLRRVIRSGMTPGINSVQFIFALLFPVTPRGLWDNIRGNLRDAMSENANAGVVLLRVVVTATFVALFLFLAGWQGLLVGYVLPVLAIYPLFAWWSLLSKHRWHIPYDPTLDRRNHDFEHGRATDFDGVTGAIQRYLFFPMSDAYHLAHHMYPYVRFEYFPIIDRNLKIQEPRYTKYISRGMFLESGGQPGALSELYDRLVTQSASRLAIAGGTEASAHLMTQRRRGT